MTTTRNDDSTDALAQVLQDHLSPDAVAAIGALLQTAGNYRTRENEQAIREVEWFAELCHELGRGSDIGRDGL